MSEQTSWTMPGTTGSVFPVMVQTNRGKVGHRPIGGGQYRIRVVPMDNGSSEHTLAGAFPASAGWKQVHEGGQFRFSLVVTGEAALQAAVTAAAKELARKARKVEVNPEAPDWVKEAVTAKA